MVWSQSVVSVIGHSSVSQVKCVNLLKKKATGSVKAGDFFIGIASKLKKKGKVNSQVIKCVFIGGKKNNIKNGSGIYFRYPFKNLSVIAFDKVISTQSKPLVIWVSKSLFTHHLIRVKSYLLCLSFLIILIFCLVKILVFVLVSSKCLLCCWFFKFHLKVICLIHGKWPNFC